MDNLDRLFPDLILNNLNSQRKSGKFCDVRLSVGKHYTWIHSSIMCSLSPFISKECCNANKTPQIGCYKRFSFNSPLTIKLYKKDTFDCFKCLQMLTDIIYGQKIDFDPLHTSHLYNLCNILNLSDVLMKLIYNRIQINKEPNDSLEPPNKPSEKIVKDIELDVSDSPEKTEGPNNTKRKVRSMRSRLSVSNLKALSGKMQACLDCSFKCYKPSNLLTHLRDTGHGGNVCSLCLSQFESHEKLTDHYQLHDHPKPFFCSVCDLRFQTRGFLNQHLPRHSKETPYMCSFCQKGFKWKYGLNSHLMTHSNEKKFLCDECGFSTVYAKTMRAHKLTHTGELFRCSFPGCMHTCSRKENMKIHLSTHSNDKPFVCEICGLKFTLNKSLKRHAMIHNEVGVVKTCPHCPFEALRTDNLKAHILRQHGDKQLSLELSDNIVNQTDVNVDVAITEQRSFRDFSMEDLSVLADAASSLSKIKDVTSK